MLIKNLKIHKLIACLIFLFIAYGCAGHQSAHKSAIIDAAGSGDLGTVKNLHAEGQNINEADSSGATPLMHAIWRNKPDVAKFLITSGANIKARDSNGYDAFIWAVKYDQREIIDLLLDKGADVNSRDIEGLTPLAHAVWYTGNIDTIRLLLKRGANPNLKFNDGSNLFDKVFDVKNWKTIAKELMQAGASLTEPEPGKARLIFIQLPKTDFAEVKGEYYRRNIWVYVGENYRILEKDKIVFMDVPPGNHMIKIAASWYETNPQRSITAEVGRTYLYTIAPSASTEATTALAVFGLGGIVPAIAADRIGAMGPWAINLLPDQEAKIMIEERLK